MTEEDIVYMLHVENASAKSVKIVLLENLAPYGNTTFNSEGGCQYLEHNKS